MARYEALRLKAALEDTRAALSSVQECINDIQGYLHASELIPEAAICSLLNALEAYTGSYNALRHAEEQLLLPPGDRLDEIGEALQRYEERQELAQLREVILGFFRLTAERERMRALLETAKQSLVEICRGPLSEAIEAIRPFEIVVERVKEREEKPFSDADYAAVREAFGEGVAAAVDDRRLKIALEIDPSQYLKDAEDWITAAVEGSGEWEMPSEDDCIEEVSGKDGAEGNVETGAGGGDSAYDDIQKPEKPSFRMRANAAAISLSVAQIKKLVKQFPSLPYALSMVANEKLVAAKTHADQTPRECQLEPKLVEICVKYGLLAYAELDVDGKMSSYLTLTPEGWRYFNDQKRQIALIGQNIAYMVPKPLRACEWTDIFAFRAALLSDYFTARDMAYSLVQPRGTSFAFAYGAKRGKTGSLVSTALLEKGREREDIAWLRGLAHSCQTSGAEQLVLLVKTDEEIPCIRKALALPDDVEKLIEYVCISNGIAPVAPAT